jgi:hypothetical protein
MNRRTLIVVPLVALATIVIAVAASGGRSTHLPLPKTVPLSAAVHKTTAGKPAHAGTGADGPTTPAYIIQPPVPLAGCTVSVSNPSPLRGQTAETATVTTAPGAHVRLDASYSRARSTHGGLASSTGTISFPLPISHAPVNSTVSVVATASLRGIQRQCSTSFTPI